MAQFGYFGINDSCHEGKVPLMVTAVDIKIVFGGVKIWINRSKPP